MADEEGSGKSKDILDAAQYREAVSAMEHGEVKAKTKVAYYKLTGLGGVEFDEDEAVVLLEERAKDGDNEAKWILGLCYEYGIGIEQDIERAELLYQESSEGGNVVGRFLLENDEGGRGSGVMKVKSLWNRRYLKWWYLTVNSRLFVWTDMTEEMKKILCDVICVAPWTELNLRGVEKEKEEKE